MVYQEESSSFARKANLTGLKEECASAEIFTNFMSRLEVVCKGSRNKLFVSKRIDSESTPNLSTLTNKP